MDIRSITSAPARAIARHMTASYIVLSMLVGVVFHWHGAIAGAAALAAGLVILGRSEWRSGFVRGLRRSAEIECIDVDIEVAVALEVLRRDGWEVRR